MLTLYGQLCHLISPITDNHTGGEDVSTAWNKAKLHIMANKMSDKWTPWLKLKQITSSEVSF